VDSFRFIFWEAMKALSLLFLAVLAAKSIGSLRADGQATQPRRLAWSRGVLYAILLALAALGARGIGYDLAAQFYFWASQDNLAHFQASRGYANALRAVKLRPGELRYWRTLARSKFAEQRFASMLEDEPAFRSLSGGRLEEEDALRFAFAHFFLAEYDQAIFLTRQIIKENRYYAAPYVLEGMAYLNQKKYPDAERTFLAVLQMFPSQEDAVRGLAQLYFIRGEHARALAVLNETAKFPFPADARQRFQDLKALYSAAAGPKPER
jgi:tetratricopeptide (TPR) repeat protein